jgi:peptidylprolyl isomerase
MPSLVLDTELGSITLALLPEIAPVTVAHISKNVADGLYNGLCFYRSDFVIQFGTYGSSKASRHPPLPVNESGRGASNLKGTLAVAHHDKPDCGSTELFINIVDSPHLDTAYGGYAVAAKVGAEDQKSWATISAVAAAIKDQGRKPVIKVASIVQ